MSLSPKTLLSRAARERCIANLKELPVLFNKDEIKPKYTASVLIPLCVNQDEVCILYTLRSSNLSSHSGQVSFPGGKMDKNENVIQTALRETEEEIGVPQQDVDVWTEMTPVQGRGRDILVTPVVGQIIDYDFKKLRPNADEVEEIFTIPMSGFCDKKNHAHLKYENYTIPVFIYGKYKVWGISGIITHMFLQNFLPKEEYNVDFWKKRYSLEELMPSKL